MWNLLFNDKMAKYSVYLYLNFAGTNLPNMWWTEIILLTEKLKNSFFQSFKFFVKLLKSLLKKKNLIFAIAAGLYQFIKAK
jgi:hypothetical protein